MSLVSTTGRLWVTLGILQGRCSDTIGTQLGPECGNVSVEPDTQRGPNFYARLGWTHPCCLPRIRLCCRTASYGDLATQRVAIKVRDKASSVRNFIFLRVCPLLCVCVCVLRAPPLPPGSGSAHGCGFLLAGSAGLRRGGEESGGEGREGRRWRTQDTLTGREKRKKKSVKFNKGKSRCLHAGISPTTVFTCQQSSGLHR